MLVSPSICGVGEPEKRPKLMDRVSNWAEFLFLDLVGSSLVSKVVAVSISGRSRGLGIF